MSGKYRLRIKGGRERAMGRMLMGIRKELTEKRIVIERKEEGIMVGRRMENSLKWEFRKDVAENGTVDRGKRIKN